MEASDDEPPGPEYVVTTLGERVRVLNFDFNKHTPEFLQTIIDARCNGNATIAWDLFSRLKPSVGRFTRIRAERDGGKSYEVSGRLYSFFCKDDDPLPETPLGTLLVETGQRVDKYKAVYADRMRSVIEIGSH